MLGSDDSSEIKDFSFRQGYLMDHCFFPAFENLLFYHVNVFVDVAQLMMIKIEDLLNKMVKKRAGALAEIFFFQGGVGAAFFQKAVKRRKISVVDGNEMRFCDENVQLGRDGCPFDRIEHGNVKHHEQKMVVMLDF